MSGAPNPNPNALPLARKPKKANPLRPLRKPQRPANPLVASRKPAPKPGGPSSNSAKPGTQNAPKPSLEELRKMHGGWSQPPPTGPYSDIPIMTTKKALLDGVRYHLMKFYQPKIGDHPIDPTDQEDFARPVTLHRRDARAPPPGRMAKEEAPEPAPVDEDELEKQAQIKAQKEAQKAIDQAKIAPVTKDAAAPKPKPKKESRERTNFNRAPRTEAARKESDLRYEEALPWHIEDADGKNVWVGSYIAALSEANVAFKIDGSVFRMVPLEKWYKFTAKPPFQAFTIDEAEEFMGRKVNVGRWVMKDEERKAGQADMAATRDMFYGRGKMIKTESNTFASSSRAEKLEHDELDVSGDEFQDDDEAHTFDRHEDEETKDSNTRIRREQLGANLFGDADEQEIDKDLEAQLKEEEERKKFGKETKKQLINRDKETIYESDDSQENPWTSSSEDDSSNDEEDDEEKKKEEGKEGQEDVKDKEKDKAKPKGSTPQSKQKQGEMTKKANNLKRAGSPTMSESSGNESSRKKMKKTATSAVGSRAGTPLPQGAAARRTKMGAGSGSDGEGTAGEMSDGAVAKRKIKILAKGGRDTPSASRAGSPNPPTGAVSPGGASAVIDPQEILNRIPPEGIVISDLIRPFSGKIGEGPGQVSKAEWIKLVRQLCDYGPDKRLRKRK